MERLTSRNATVNDFIDKSELNFAAKLKQGELEKRFYSIEKR